MSRTGWAAGILIGGDEWLTIPGSAYRRVTLHETPELAREELTSWHPSMRGLVRKVEEVYHPGVTVTQTGFRVIDTPPWPDAKYDVPAFDLPSEIETLAEPVD
jgi:hypothetical protein